MPEIHCAVCGHYEQWESGDYFGEKTDFAHHVCGSNTRSYAMCGPDCNHSFPGCALIPEHPRYNRANSDSPS